MKNIIIILSFILAASISQAQEKKKNAKLSLEVNGVCNMCKKRIEKAALDTKGVKYANWNVNTHELVVIIDERKTDKNLVCQSMANAGHDTKITKASQEAYDNLHHCCKYRDEETINNHDVR